MEPAENHIIKIAGLPIDDYGRLLIVKWKGRPIWFSLGGVLEAGESDEECLKREVFEELGVEVEGDMNHFYDTPVETAAGRDDTTVEIRFYTMSLPDGIEVDDDEIEDFRWISEFDFAEMETDPNVEIASGLAKHAIPHLISTGLMR